MTSNYRATQLLIWEPLSFAIRIQGTCCTEMKIKHRYTWNCNSTGEIYSALIIVTRGYSSLSSLLNQDLNVPGSHLTVETIIITEDEDETLRVDMTPVEILLVSHVERVIA